MTNYSDVLNNFLNAKPIQWLFKLRTKLIVPYVSLTLLVAMIGIFIVTRLVSSSVQERFSNQLVEASGVAADMVVRQEQDHLESLRLMAFTTGVPEAMFANDSAKLEELIYPLVLNEQVESLAVIDNNGTEIISFFRNPSTNQYGITNGSDYFDFEIVNLILRRQSDAKGDKFSSLTVTIFGPYLFTGAPVLKTDTGEFVGLLVIGTQLQTVAQDIKSQALADTLILDETGNILVTTFAIDDPADNKKLMLDANDLDKFNQDQDTRAYSQKATLATGKQYEIYYSPLVIRERDVGILGIALSTKFVVDTQSTSRTSLSWVFTLVTLIMIITGYVLSIMISRPILRLRDISRKVAAGDLQQRSGIERRDEIGDLAESFDQMVIDLNEHTHALIQSEKLSAVGQLSAGIAHDVKNPLAVIKGMAEELQDDIKDPEIKSMLEIIRDNATRASDIITDLMKFTRQSKFELKPQNICHAIEAATRLTDFLARKGKVDVQTNFKTNPIRVAYDSQQIEQVLVNLFQNSVQAMKDGGNLDVFAYESGKWAVIKVKDTGEGISQENLEKIFDPFFTTKPEGEGTGLGLSVSFGIIRDHGGKIKADSKIGVGTTFTILLPLAKAM